jgi:hypothetical protein
MLNHSSQKMLRDVFPKRMRRILHCFRKSFRSEFSRWSHGSRIGAVLPAAAAVGALVELSPGKKKKHFFDKLIPYLLRL